MFVFGVLLGWGSLLRTVYATFQANWNTCNQIILIISHILTHCKTLQTQ